MQYRDLRDFIANLEADGELSRVKVPVDPNLEMTVVCDRTLRAGPAILFENPTGFDMPVLGNLFGTPERVARAMGCEDVSALRAVGELLAELREPKPPKGIADAVKKLPMFKKVPDMAPKRVRRAPWHDIELLGDEVDLSKLPIQTCWPGDAGPLITWALVITRGPHKERQNLGIYRQQVIGRNRTIMRWLAHRGGAVDYAEWQRTHPGEPFPDRRRIGRRPRDHPRSRDARA